MSGNKNFKTVSELFRNSGLLYFFKFIATISYLILNNYIYLFLIKLKFKLFGKTEW